MRYWQRERRYSLVDGQGPLSPRSLDLLALEYLPLSSAGLQFVGMEHVEAHTMRLIGTVPAVTMKSSTVYFQPYDVALRTTAPISEQSLASCISRDSVRLSSSYFRETMPSVLHGWPIC